MNKDKEIKLNKAVEKVYNIGFALDSEDELETYFSEKLMIIGTAADEQFSNLDGLRKLIAHQREQTRGIETKYTRKETSRDYRGDENVAIISEDLHVEIKANNDTFEFDCRTSLVLTYENNQWKLIHWHASKPEMVQSGADTFGMEEWKRKTTALEKLVEERTADLKSKNRELEVESSLERVRTVAMSMQKADDLLKVSEVMYKELVALGFSEIRNALVQTFEDGVNYFLDYDYSDLTGACKSRIALKGHATIEKFIRDIRESKQPFTELEINGEELEKWKAFRKMNNEADDPRLDNISSLYYYCYAVGAGSMGISTFSPISDEKREILKRFRNVFDFAYRRFEDLKNAEQQFREAQIELALERVRARAMAMQHSDELMDASRLLDQQVRSLGIATWGCAFNIFGDNNSSEWFSSEAGILQAYNLPRENVFLRYYNESQKGNELYIEEFSGEVCISHYEYLCTLPGVGDALEKVKASGGTFPEKQIDHVAPFKYGYLLFITLEHVPEAHDIFKRFAKIFEQTYMRFLDLQKAEAQTRESQIELGLERVRARAMAMQTSDELKGLIGTVFTELTKLDLVLTRCVIMIFNNDTSDSKWWMANSEDPDNPNGFFVRSHDHPPVAAYFKSWHQRELKWTYVLEGKVKKDWDVFLFNETELKNLPDFVKEGMKAPDRVYLNASFNNFGNLTLATLEPLSEEQFDILLRFAKVFDLTYTRFNDLQKAESQAREAQIEASLERIRAKAMSMHRSEELDEVLSVLFDQFSALGIDCVSTHMTLIDIDNNTFTFRETGKKGHRSYGEQTVAIDSMDIWEHEAEKWRNSEPLAINYIHFPKEALPQVWQVFHESFAAMPDDAKIYPEDYPDGIHHTAGNCKFGYIGMNQVRKATEEEKQIVIKFATEFGRFYQRFLDLKKAEAQAKEANIESGLEKVRSRSLAMHRSDELQAIVNTLFEKLTELGIQMDTGAILNHNRETHDTEAWIQNAAQSFSTVHKIPYNKESRISREFVEFLENSEGQLVKTYSKEDKDAWFAGLFATGLKNIPDERKRYVLNGQHQASCLSRTRNGGIFLARYYDKNFSADEQAIIKRFVVVFDQAYIRFLDLQRAEAQTREAQIEASLERVRARAMAMHKSEDLHEAVAVVFEELDKLDLGVLRVGISVLNKEKRTGNVWLTSIDEGKAVQVYGDESFDIHPLLQGSMDAWINRKDFYYVLEGDDLVRYYKAVEEAQFRLPESQMLSREGEHKMQSCFVAVYNSGGLFAFREGEFPDEARQVMRRFASVFDLTYQRFLDLQKAESQAKEAMIEAALERVRSKAMSMHSSQDLADTIGVFYKELKSFNVTPRRCGVGLLNKESRSGELFTWNTTETGESLELVGRLVMEGHPVLNEVYDNWLSQTEYHPVLRGREIPEYYSIIKPQMHFPEYAHDAVQYGYFFFFPEGGVYAWTQTEMSEPELEIYRRFTSVLSLTYKRYKDLQQAEALARQAELDLIQLKEEKRKTEEALTELKNTQKQLIQSEKMASLGELTAGIAHEIQNPLNFVNNFSEVSNELLDEMMEEVAKGNYEEVKAIAEDVKQNLAKINHHGKRADGIVKGMLQHSRASNSQQEPVSINELADEYLRLAYHGLRAKDKTFNASVKTDFDENVGKLNVIPQDIGRVILNLITNAFYVVDEKKKEVTTGYEPTVSVSSKRTGDFVHIRVTDNGKGIPPAVLDKIFQPFFTTKPTGQGTGLGLSLSYDIVKAHGGELKVETRVGEGSTFIIQLPVSIV